MDECGLEVRVSVRRRKVVARSEYLRAVKRYSMVRAKVCNFEDD